ncbi:HEAT repeat domain-containing protein [Haloarcula litorea]|uniref:HEAT repeat domain-containing protein n=1 Tax=Haloarcula litorea TaxID=3032579 RepID=UPI0023E75C8B|nr:hypothetical protein [Halomicroarcula sp. GDY20]
MDESESPADGLAETLHTGDAAAAEAHLERLRDRDPETAKAALRDARSVLADDGGTVEGVAQQLAAFLAAEDRSLRLTAAKTLVAAADADPEGCRPAAAALADRLADETEFYYVRARCAEALGYLALAAPDEVGTPERLADLRVGLAFDEPEVREKLAKALECVALADPDRLTHLVGSLSDHLDDDRDLVRYHLCTMLVATGDRDPAALADARDALAGRLDDEVPQVRGRAAEALGVLARTDADGVPIGGLRSLRSDDEQFVADRAAFALDAADSDAAGDEPFGDVEALRGTTDEMASEITAAPEGECPHCGFELPPDGPPMCPRCGGPR